MHFFRSAALAFCVVGIGMTAAAAQDVATPTLKIPKISTKTKATAGATTTAKVERRPGELEGGFNSGVTAPVTPKKKRPADAVSEKTMPDGGLPLPDVRERGPGDAPVGFDSKGNMGGMFRF